MFLENGYLQRDPPIVPPDEPPRENPEDPRRPNGSNLELALILGFSALGIYLLVLHHVSSKAWPESTLVHTLGIAGYYLLIPALGLLVHKSIEALSNLRK